MKRITLSMLLLYFLAAGNLFAQTAIEPTFISVNNKYEFTLPQFDVSLALPAKAEFRVPLFSGKNIKLEIDDVTCYYFDLSYLKKPNAFPFLFKLPSQKEESFLMMHIMELNKSDIERTVDNAIPDGQVERLAGIKTKLGKTTSYLFKIEYESTTETHVVTKGDYSFVFTFKADIDKKTKKQYLNLIKNFKEKSQPYLKVRYETQVENGEFEPKKEEKKKTTPREIAEEKGTLASSSFFEWPALGYGIHIPEGWQFRVDGHINPTNDGRLKVQPDKSFFEDGFMTMSWFNNDELYVYLRSYRQIDLPGLINGQAQNAKHSQSAHIIIDGIPFKAQFYGSKEYGSLDFGFEAKGTYHWVSFSGVSKQTLPLVQELLATMQIESERSKSENATISDLSAQLKLKDLSPVELDNPLQLTDNWPDEELFECKLADLNTRIKLPGKQSDYMYTIGNVKGSIENGAIHGTPENSTDKRLMIYSLAGSPVSFSFSKPEYTIPNEKYILGFKRGWSIYKNIEFIHGSIAHINGQEWCVCVTRNDITYVSMLTTHVDDYEVMVTIMSANKEDALASVSYLKNILIE